MTERRFTDREVALIFERATEPRGDDPERDAPGAGIAGVDVARGLSLAQLQEIGREVGISEERIARAVAELGRARGLRLRGLLGPDPRAREIRSVPARLAGDEIAELVRVMDERVPAQGTVTEALGSVRWSASSRFLSHQLSVEPGEGETLLRVEERYEDRVRWIAHGLPFGYGAGFGLLIGAEVVGGVAAAVLGVVILGLAGWLLGRGVWSVLSHRSAGRTHELADELAGLATAITAGRGVEAGEPDGGPRGE